MIIQHKSTLDFHLLYMNIYPFIQVDIYIYIYISYIYLYIYIYKLIYIYIYIYIYHSLNSLVFYSLMLYINISILYIFKFKFSSESCKNTTEEVYQDVNESFCIIRSSLLISIFTHYWQKWFIDVRLYSPWSADSFETRLFGFYFYVTLWTANNASLF